MRRRRLGLLARALSPRRGGGGGGRRRVGARLRGRRGVEHLATHRPLDAAPVDVAAEAVPVALLVVVVAQPVPLGGVVAHDVRRVPRAAAALVVPPHLDAPPHQRLAGLDGGGGGGGERLGLGGERLGARRRLRGVLEGEALGEVALGDARREGGVLARVPRPRVVREVERDARRRGALPVLGEGARVDRRVDKVAEAEHPEADALAGRARGRVGDEARRRPRAVHRAHRARRRAVAAHRRRRVHEEPRALGLRVRAGALDPRDEGRRVHRALDVVDVGAAAQARERDVRQLRVRLAVELPHLVLDHRAVEVRGEDLFGRRVREEADVVRVVAHFAEFGRPRFSARAVAREPLSVASVRGARAQRRGSRDRRDALPRRR